MSESAASIRVTVKRANRTQITRGSVPAEKLFRDIDRGWRYFWSKRNVPPPGRWTVGGHTF